MRRHNEAPRPQFINFAFHKVIPEWRRLPLVEREKQRRELAETIRKWNVPDTMGILSYSLVGTRGDADFMIWRICYSLPCLQEMSSDLLRTRLGGYLETTHSYLGMTRRSEYHISRGQDDPQPLRGVVVPGGFKFLFVFPMVRTRNWYQLPFEERQRMVQQIVALDAEFPRTQMHVIYSFGIDDQEFVLAVETDHPEDVVEFVMRLRETDSGTYMERDTPNFTCVQAPVEEMLERIG